MSESNSKDYIGKTLDPKTLIAYKKGSIVGREILKGNTGTVTVFSFDQGQSLSEHKTPFNSMVHVLEGEALITISGEPHIVKTGQLIILPANEPHSMRAEKHFMMLLVMIRG